MNKKNINTEDNEEKKKEFDASMLLDNSPIVSDKYNTEADILKQKIAEKDVKNIAIISNYGGGKSSVIKTYLDKNRKGKRNEKTFTKISLASFNDNTQLPDEIERSILQQLLYSQPKNKLPNSSIIRTEKSSIFKTIYLALMLTLIIASITLITLQLKGIIFLGVNWLYYVYVFVFIFAVLNICLHLIHHKRLFKITYKDIGAEIAKCNFEDVKGENGLSLINRFADEVIYFFQCTKVDLVIFEDLDRLGANAVRIFTKLRELNTIINNSAQHRRKVTFLYALKTDLLDNPEERAKFFEFVLQIIPVLNPLTASEEIRKIQGEIIKANGDFKLNDEFINQISVYIPDMRILKNTYNDYIVMYDKLINKSKKNLIKENLFAMSLYKNLYPQDYALLENKEGLIPVFLNKTPLVKRIIEDDKTQIQQYEKELEQIDNEFLKSFDELKLIFKGLCCTCQRYGYLSSNAITIDQIKTFEKLNDQSVIHPIYPGNGIANCPSSLPNGESFFEREKKLKDAISKKRDVIINQLNELKNNVEKIKQMSILELVDEQGIEYCFNSNNDIDTTYVNNNDSIDNNYIVSSTYNKHKMFLIFLIKNHYIDENYLDYTSNYSEGLVSAQDMNYITKLQLGYELYDQKLDDVESVIERLQISNFKEIGILNNCILENVNLIQKKDKEKYKTFKSYIMMNDRRIFDIILKYIVGHDGNNLEQFLDIVLINNYDLINYLVEEKTLPDSKKNTCINVFFNQLSDDINEQKLKQVYYYINNSEKYLEILDLKPKILDRLLYSKQIIITTLNKNYNSINKKLIQHKCFTITLNNLEIALNIKNAKDTFYYENTKCVKSSQFWDHIIMHINDYVQNILLSKELLNNKESDSMIIEFLKNDSISVDNKLNIIKRYDFKISDISILDKQLYYELLCCCRLESNWNNINILFENDLIFNKSFVTFLDKNKEIVKLENTYDVKNITNIIVSVIKHEYDEETKILPLIFSNIINFSFDLSQEMTNDDNLYPFIHANKVNFCVNDFGILKNASKSFLAYCLNFQNKISGVFNEFFNEFSQNNLVVLLKNEEINNNFKQKILNCFGASFDINGFEEEIYNIIFACDLKITEDLLFKFTHNEKLTNNQKQNLLTVLEISGNRKGELNDFVKACIPEIDGLETSGKCKITNCNEKIIPFLSEYAKKNNCKISKRVNNVFLNRA